MPDPPAARCSSCGAPLAADQRYCLQCGERAGPAGPLLAALIERVRTRAAAPSAAAPAPADGPGAARAPTGLRPPSRPVSALLVALFLGFGLLIGNVTGTPPRGVPAATQGHLKLLTSARSGAPATERKDVETEPPAIEQTEATPEAPSAESATATESQPRGSSQSSAGNEGTAKRQSGTPKEPAVASKLPAVKHVFVIVLSDQPYAALFGPESPGHFLSSTLERKGELLVRYDAVAHEQLANEIALISGQGPTAQTAANCPQYSPVRSTGTGASEQVLGDGCVYPAHAKTIGDQLAAKHLIWRAYVQGIDEGRGQPQACAHPALGAADQTLAATPSAAYATYKNPFMYFESMTGDATCAQHSVGLSQLANDLRKPATTPNFAYIAPDRCHDASPLGCPPGAGQGPADAEPFLATVVPEILASPVYKRDGLLVITGDEAPSSGEFADSSSCCGQPAFPNLPDVSSGPRAPAGGGAVGALLLSPFVKGGTTSQEPFNHFALLRTIEDLFHVTHLGYAAAAGVKSLPPALFAARR